MKEIPLYNSDKVALVDDADYELVLKYKWRLFNPGHLNYAYTKKLYMHRLIMAPPAGMNIDHINRDGLDNRRSNLRLATQAQNRANSVGTNHFRGLLRSKGTYFDKSRGKYMAIIVRQKKHHYRAYFATREEAARAYDAMARELDGEFARLNYPEDVTA